MAVTGLFTGPMVLLGLSLSTPDEPTAFRALIRLGSVLGTLPAAVMRAGVPSMLKRAAIAPERQAELRVDFARNNTRDMRRGLREYLTWLHRDDDPAQRLCAAGVPTWIMHAEKGDGGLTAHERSVLESCPNVRLVTIPGEVFFLPNEVPERVAALIGEAMGAVATKQDEVKRGW
jgi:pimeloyl-ACP methyl ester carboxylesterase